MSILGVGGYFSIVILASLVRSVPFPTTLRSPGMDPGHGEKAEGPCSAGQVGCELAIGLCEFQLILD